MRFFGSKTPRWIYAGSSLDGEKFEIEGVNVWEHAWEDSRDETAVVQDPIYGQTFHFGIYHVEADGKVIEFAAGEFSNCVWGFYVRNKPDAV